MLFDILTYIAYIWYFKTCLLNFPLIIIKYTHCLNYNVSFADKTIKLSPKHNESCINLNYNLKLIEWVK